MKSGTVTLIAGIICLAVLVLPLGSVVKTMRMKKSGVLTEGTVTDRDTRSKGLKRITVTFITKESTEVTATAPMYRYAQKGDKVNVWYDPENPQKIDFGDTISYNMRGVVVLSLLAVFFFYLFIRKILIEKRRSSLRTTGMKISVEYLVDRNEKYRMGANNPWIIIARWTDPRTNRDYKFESDSYTVDPSAYLAGRMTIDIYIDPQNPTNYFMDTSFMPAKSNMTMGS